MTEQPASAPGSHGSASVLVPTAFAQSEALENSLELDIKNTVPPPAAKHTIKKKKKKHDVLADFVDRTDTRNKKARNKRVSLNILIPNNVEMSSEAETTLV